MLNRVWKKLTVLFDDDNPVQIMMRTTLCILLACISVLMILGVLSFIVLIGIQVF